MTYSMGQTKIWEDITLTAKRSSLSGPLNMLLVPPPHGLVSEFFYNFYTPDETLNDDGYGGDFASGVTGEGVQLAGGSVSAGDAVNPNHDPNTDVEFLFQIEHVAPRMVRLSFNGPSITTSPDYINNNVPTTVSSLENNENFLRIFLTDAMDESAFASASPTVDYCTLVLQDDDAGIDVVDQALFSVFLRDTDLDIPGFFENLSFNVKKLFSSKNFVFGNTWISSAQNATKSAGGVGGAFLDAAIAAWNAQMPAGISVFDLASGDRKGTGFTTDLSQVQLLSQINYKIAGDIMKFANEVAVGPYVDSICVDAPHADLIQEKARSLVSQISSIVGPDDYDLDMPDVTSQLSLMIDLKEKMPKPGTEDTGGIASSPGVIKPMGYILEKFEILEGGLKNRLQSRVFGTTNISSGIDTKVKIGSSYLYQARTAVLFEYDAIDDITGKVYRASSLVLSRPSNTTTVHCTPNVKPPKAPTDLRFVWDYDNEYLHFYWAFPVEKERDVRYFQVFRRKTVNESFQLLAEYDFNDNLGSYERNEYIRPSLVTKMLGNIRTFYTDPEFKKDSVYIYAVVALDAYGHSSGYSDQFVVHFDRTLNEIKAEAISPSDAPKAYPNFYMKSNVDGFPENTNFTEDLMRSSMAKKMTVYFSPDALSITSDNIDQNHLVYASKGGNINFDTKTQYLMQITNLDRQKTHVVPISLNKTTEDI